MTTPREPSGLRKADDADLHPSTPGTQDLDPGWLRSGANTGDSVGMPGKDKPVTLEVTLPKSLRKAVRQEAKSRGVSVDEIVAEALRNRQRH